MSASSGSRARHAARIALIGSQLLAAVAAGGDAPWRTRFQHLSVQDGLSQSTVHAVVQDRQGFLWVGSDYGLNRYDGSGFTVFSHDAEDPSSLGGNRVRALAVGPEGAIWVGTLESGLDRWSPATGLFEHFRHRSSDPGSLASDQVRALAVDTRGDLWIATAAGLDRLPRGSTRFIHHRHDPADPTSLVDDSVTALAVDPGGGLWVGTSTGLQLWLGQERGFRPFPRLPEGLVSSVAPDPRRGVWVGYRWGGLAHLEPATGVVRRFRATSDPQTLSSDQVRALLVDAAGHVWAGTADRGLNRVEPASGEVARIPLVGDETGGLDSAWIGALCVDRSQILWIGTDFGGVARLDLRPRPFAHLERQDGLPSDIVMSVLERAGGELWVGTTRGLAIVTATGEARRPERLAGVPVYALAEHPGGDVWIGTWASGLYRHDAATGTFRQLRHDPDDPASLAHDVVKSLLVDRRGRLWVGTFGGGLDLLREDGRGFIHHPADPDRPDALPSSRVLALAEDESGALWIGTDAGGLSRLDEPGGPVLTYRPGRSDPRSIGDDSVSALAVDAAGRLWVGTAAGLDRLDQDGFVHFGHAQGLPSEAVAGVQVDDDGRVWVAHFRGLSRLDPASGEIVTFDDGDGLATLEFNTGASARGPRGMLHFGGVGGLVSFRPGEVARNTVPPLVAITSVEVYGEPLAPPGALLQGPVRLAHTQDFLSFAFVGLEFTAPEHNRYAYRLDGLDRDWVDAGSRRQASYAHLRPGRYRFRVRAANNHGVWSRREASLKIVIVPPFWQTWWFRVAAAVAVVLVVAGAVAGRIRALRLRVVEQERLVRERTAALAAANARLEDLAVRDELTGVANRRRFDRSLDREWRRCARFGRPLSMVMVDIDDFKRYNDTLGHPSGDRCLRDVAAALAGVVNRPGDVLARYGGEEFAALLPETAAAAAAALAERMRAAVEELGLPHPGLEGDRPVTVSVGVATLVPADPERPGVVVEAADRALYRAKGAGKNRVEVAARGRPPAG